MCVISNMGDQYRDTFPKRWPNVVPHVEPTAPIVINNPPVISREEFEALKQEVEELRKFLLAAKDFDRMTGQPDCEHGDKVALIKKLAELVDVDMDDVFG